jgi:hypothetical protein
MEDVVNSIPSYASSCPVRLEAAGVVRSAARSSAAGSALPDDRISTVGPVISVSVPGVTALDERNSTSRPTTRTSSPTATVGGLPVNTKSASDVVASPSLPASGT